MGNLAHTLHQENCGQQDANCNSNYQVKCYGEHESEHQHQDVALGSGLADADEGAPVAHIVSYHQKDCRDGGHRNQCRIGHQYQHNQQEHYCVHHTCDGSTAAVFDICGSTGDCAGCRNTAKQCGGNVTCALCYQLHIGTVAAADHTVSNYAGQKRFNCRQNRDGECVGEHGLRQLQGFAVELRQSQCRQTAFDGVESANGIYLHRQTGYHCNTHQNCDERSGNLLEEAGEHRPQDQYQQRYYTYHQCLPVEGGDVLNHAFQLFNGFYQRMFADNGQTQEILDLSHYDGQCNTCGKADGNGIRDELNQAAQTEHAHQNQQNTCHNGSQHQAFQAVCGNHARYDGSKCGGRAGNLHAAATQEGDDKACKNSGVDTHYGGHVGSDRQRDRKRKRDNGNDDTSHYVLTELGKGIIFHDRKQLRLEFVHGYLPHNVRQITTKVAHVDYYTPPVFVCQWKKRRFLRPFHPTFLA